MGLFFGGLHLAYGIYLYFTESAKECGVNPEPFLQLDRVIHEKGRLAIMSMLAASPELSFTELRDALDMTDGNLTTHIRTLQEAGYVSVAKSYREQSPAHDLLADRRRPESLRRIHQPAGTDRPAKQTRIKILLNEYEHASVFILCDTK